MTIEYKENSSFESIDATDQESINKRVAAQVEGMLSEIYSDPKKYGDPLMFQVYVPENSDATIITAIKSVQKTLESIVLQMQAENEDMPQDMNSGDYLSIFNVENFNPSYVFAKLTEFYNGEGFNLFEKMPKEDLEDVFSAKDTITSNQYILSLVTQTAFITQVSGYLDIVSFEAETMH